MGSFPDYRGKRPLVLLYCLLWALSGSHLRTGTLVALRVRVATKKEVWYYGDCRQRLHLL